MGLVFGVTNAAELGYQTIKESDDYEIRYYRSHLVAEVEEPNKNEAFLVFAKYIGAIGASPQNMKRKCCFW